MTAPVEDTGARPAAAAEAPRLRRGQIVQFTFTDPILGGTYTDAGVVVALPDEDGAPVTIRPLTHHDVSVPVADVSPVGAADVAG